MANTEKRIKKILTDTLGLHESALTSEANFKTDLNIDSLDMGVVIVTIEKEFRITIPDEHIEGIQTVQQLVDYVNKTIHLEPAETTAHSKNISA